MNEQDFSSSNPKTWSSVKTLKNIADAYSSIYEAKKKVDQDQDGDNDFADVRIARMIASGMTKAQAIAAVRNLDEGIGSAIRGLFGKSKPKPSRGEELRSKYGSPARFGRPFRTPSGEKTKTRYDITLNSSGKEAAEKVHQAALNMLGVAPRDTGSHDPGTVTSGNYEGGGNRAKRRMGKPPEDTRSRVEDQVGRGHINSRGVRKPLARSTNAEGFELWVDGLLNEGYDLSDYTWDEMADIYLDEATAMSKRGLDEPAIRNIIAKKTAASGAGSFADKATALADRETYGDTKKKEGREKLARKQRGDFRNTTSSSPGLRGYGHQSNDPAVKAKQDARGAQRGRAALTPNERKQLNMEFDFYDLVLSHLLDEGYADTNENALVIMVNMSEEWRESILLDERIRDSPRPDKEEYMKRREIMRQNAKQAEREASTNNLIRSRKPPEPRKPDRVGNPSSATPSGEGLNPQRKPPRPRVVTRYVPPVDPSTGAPVDLAARTSMIKPFGTVKPPFVPPAAPIKKQK
jgi:hypothetical protein